MKKLITLMIGILFLSLSALAQHEEHDCAAHHLEKGKGFPIDWEKISSIHTGVSKSKNNISKDGVPDDFDGSILGPTRGISLLVPYDSDILVQENLTEEQFKENCKHAMQIVTNRTFYNSGRDYYVDTLIFHQLDSNDLKNYSNINSFSDLIQFSSDFQYLHGLKSSYDIDMVLCVAPRSTTGAVGTATLMTPEVFNNDNAWGALNYAAINLAVVSGSAPQPVHEIMHMLGARHEFSLEASDGSKTIVNPSTIGFVEGISGNDTWINNIQYANPDGMNNIELVDTIHSAYMYYNRRTHMELENVENICTKGEIIVYNNILEKKNINVTYFTEADIDIAPTNNPYALSFYARESGWVEIEVWETGDAYSVTDSIYIERGEVVEEEIAVQSGATVDVPASGGDESYVITQDTTISYHGDNSNECDTLFINHYKVTTSTSTTPDVAEAGITIGPSPLSVNAPVSILANEVNMEQVTIFDLSGRIAFEDKNPEKYTEVNFLNPGLYVVEIHTKDQKVYKRKIIVHNE